MSKHEMLQIQTIYKMPTDKKRWRVFGDWLKEKREEARLSQDGLGNLAGLDRQTIYRLENAVSGTKRETVVTLAKALKTDAAEALVKAGFAPDQNLPEEIAAIGFDDLDSEDIQEIAEFIRFKKSQNRRVSPERKNDIQEIDNEIPFSKL